MSKDKFHDIPIDKIMILYDDNLFNDAMNCTEEEFRRNINYRIQCRLKRQILLRSYQSFIEFSFPLIESGAKWINANHHTILIKTLQKVVDGLITRLIINIPPRFSKTILTTTLLNAYALVKNPELTNNMVISFNEGVLSDEGKKVRDLMKTVEFNRIFNVNVDSDSSSKTSFKLTNGASQKMKTTFGQITGSSCGAMTPKTYDVFGDEEPIEFCGFMALDDTLKPADARTNKRETVNELWSSTFVSRLAMSETPVIIIMQRVHEDDLAGFALKGGTGDRWHHLLIRGETSFPMTTSRYKRIMPKATHGIPICYSNNLDDDYSVPLGATWESRKSLKDLRTIKESNLYNYSAQYDQTPVPLGGGLFKEEWLNFYVEYPEDLKYMCMYCDTAYKPEEKNDYTVFELWGLSPSTGIYLIDLFRKKMETPEMYDEFDRFYMKWRGGLKIKSRKVRLRYAAIEDKASGISLIQTKRRNPAMTIRGIPRTVSKAIRGNDVAPIIANRRVHIPLNAPFTREFVTEFAEFTDNDTHENDDQLDPMMDAIQDLLMDNKRDFSKLNK